MQPLHHIRTLMSDFPHSWFIAGGWALELAAGQQHREHEDIDLCIFREHTQAILDYFTDWDIQVAIPGEHRLVPCTTVADTGAPRYGLHLRRGDEFIEILLTDRIDDRVVFRKNASITMSLDRFARQTATGLPYVAPEWQLLYKAKEGRDRDQLDFDTHAPLLDNEGRRWLRESLQTFLPSHPWLADLQPVYLSKPTPAFQQQYLEFYEDWVASGEDMVPYMITKDPYDFPAMLQFLEDFSIREKLPNPAWVPGSTYWLINEERQVVGAVNIRHELNEALLNSGGHIGYGIRPSARRKGYATQLLALALQKAHQLGIDRALVICDRGNIGSERTILKNGGVFESEFTEEDGNVVRRFWIDIQA